MAVRGICSFARLTTILLVARLALGWGAAAPTAIGAITAISPLADGGASVSGWACQPGSAGTARVQLYVVAPYPAGQLVATTAADEDTSAAPCGVGGSRHNFNFILSAQTLFRYGSLRVFASVGAPEAEVLLGAPSEARLPDYTPLTGPPRNCEITDIPSLKRCIAQRGEFDQLSLRKDLMCTSADECCGPNKGPLIQLDDSSRRVFDGNGHVVHHAPGALVCNLVQISRGEDIVIKNLTIDEGEHVAPCELAMKDCPHTILVTNSRNVRIDNTHIYYGKGYVVYVWTTDGLVFVRSTLSESGMIGLYVGHFKYGASKNVVIAESVFAGTRTNAIALQGADSDNPQSPVLVIGNVVNRNHWHGLWPVPNVPGGVTTGGQVLAGDGSNMRIADNIIGDGNCENCVPRGQYVNAIEFADVVPAPGGVRGLTIDDNYLYNGTKAAIRYDPGSRASDVNITNNRLHGFTELDSATIPVTRSRVLKPEAGAAPTQAGAATYEALRLAASGRHYMARTPAAHPGSRIEGVFALSPAPRLGASRSPLFQCMRTGVPDSDFVATDASCSGAGEVRSVLGYPYEAGHPSAQPFYVCRTAGASGDEFLSWDPNCEGQTVVERLGYAIARASPTAIPAASP